MRSLLKRRMIRGEVPAYHMRLRHTILVCFASVVSFGCLLAGVWTGGGHGSFARPIDWRWTTESVSTRAARAICVDRLFGLLYLQVYASTYRFADSQSTRSCRDVPNLASIFSF